MLNYQRVQRMYWVRFKLGVLRSCGDGTGQNLWSSGYSWTISTVADLQWSSTALRRLVDSILADVGSWENTHLPIWTFQWGNQACSEYTEELVLQPKSFCIQSLIHRFALERSNLCALESWCTPAQVEILSWSEAQEFQDGQTKRLKNKAEIRFLQILVSMW
jgi:hypothetical protein